MYIDKDALVAEIERQQRRCDILSQSNDVELRKTAAIQNGVYSYILSFLNTLEVKEVDLEKGMEVNKELSYEDYNRFFEKHPNFPDDWGFDEAWIFAKYFFELGLKAAQKGE